MPAPKIEHKNFAFEVKDVTADGHVEAYAAVKHNIDSYGDVIDDGAFKRTIKDKKGKWPVLSNHNPYLQIGINTEAEEDDKGLKTIAWYDIHNNAKAMEHFSIIKKSLELKTPAGMSIGYMTIKAEPDKENPLIRRLKEIRMFEHSAVTFPANEQAMATGAKAQEFLPEGMSLEESLDFFMDSIRGKGYPEYMIQKALAKFREPQLIESDPDLLQSFRDGIKGLREVFKP